MRARLGLAIAVLAAAAAAPAQATTDTALGGAIAFHPFTMPSSGCVAIDSTLNCDPVNVVFPGRTPAQVRDLLRAAGWTTFDFGSTQRLHFSAATLQRQDVQVFRRDGPGTRHHVRLWRVRDATITATVGAVHHERRVGLFDDVIDRSWEAAEAEMAAQLCPALMCAQTGTLPEQSRMQGFDGLWRDWANDAGATVIG